MSVTLRKRKNQDGTTSLYLDIYDKGNRTREFLHHLKLCKPANVADRQTNKENVQLAERIAAERAQKLAASDYAIIANTGKKTVVVDWMQNHIDHYDKKDKRNMQGALNRFKDFLAKKNLLGLTFGHLTELIISEFQDYLRQRSIGEGASSYFARFKKMVKQAWRQKLIQHNPAAEVKTIAGNAREKDILTMDEIKALWATPTENNNVKRAFLFCCVTGLRWADVKSLCWRSIDLYTGRMTTRQSKTQKDVTIRLNKRAIELVGTGADPLALVFDLPSANGANKTVKAWVKRAGISKKITWHNARHSFGTNLISNGTDAFTTKNLLGHASMKHTQRYVKISNDWKQTATDALNF